MSLLFCILWYILGSLMTFMIIIKKDNNKKILEKIKDLEENSFWMAWKAMVNWLIRREAIVFRVLNIHDKINDEVYKRLMNIESKQKKKK